MSISVEDSIVLVTGAAGGIGRAICEALSESGATVIASDLMEHASVPGASRYHRHDVTSEADWASIAGVIQGEHGRLDALVNAAGIARVASIEETSLDMWRRVQAVNVESIHIGTRAMLPLLRKSGQTRPGGASIVNFSSVGGLRGAALCAAYCSSKGAVKLYSKSAAIEFGALKYNIRVNSVHPGGIETGMMQLIMQRYVELGAAPSFEAANAAVNARHPLGRMGNPAEIGAGVVYLCSSAASFVTGSELVIDGGFSAI